jgi:hypothetical protein
MKTEDFMKIPEQTFPPIVLTRMQESNKVKSYNREGSLRENIGSEFGMTMSLESLQRNCGAESR